MTVSFSHESSFRVDESRNITTGTGFLCRALDITLGRTVAVKAVRIAGGSEAERKKNLVRAQTEVQAIVKLTEKGLSVPHVYDACYSEKDRTYYVIMEWVRGETLDRKRNVPDAVFLRWMADLSRILAAMSKSGILHRDIKPANIMVTDQGKLVLIDFNASVTVANQTEGTEGYRAPETLPGSVITDRSKADMFSVGIVMYEHYAGLPVRGVDYGRNSRRGMPGEERFKWDVFVPARSKNPEMPEAADAVITRCMEYDPGKRYRDYGELAAVLDAAIRGLSRKKNGKERR